MAVDWSHLPPELLETISAKLPIYSDYLRFRAVCQFFRSSVPKTPHHLPPQLPWLLLPADSSYPSFFELQDRRVHNLRRPASGPSPLIRRRYCGSSHGWIAAVGETPEMILVNPLTASVVELPPLSAFPNVVAFDYANVGREYAVRSPSGQLVPQSLAEMRDSFVYKVVLSSGPVENPNFAAVAIFTCSHDLAFCRSGDSRWTFVDGVESYSEDVIFRDGSFYALHKSGRVAVINPRGSSSSPEVTFIASQGQVGGDLQYLLAAGDDLLLVTRHLRFEYEEESHLERYRTAYFDVFKLDQWSQPAPMWVKMETLGDYMLFVGRNSSLALQASEFPGSAGDCIYYTDDYSEYNSACFVESDIGIYRLQDGSIEPLPCYSRSPPYKIMSQPYLAVAEPSLVLERDLIQSGWTISTANVCQCAVTFVLRLLLGLWLFFHGHVKLSSSGYCVYMNYIFRVRIIETVFIRL